MDKKDLFSAASTVVAVIGCYYLILILNIKSCHSTQKRRIIQFKSL